MKNLIIWLSIIWSVQNFAQSEEAFNVDDVVLYKSERTFFGPYIRSGKIKAVVVGGHQIILDQSDKEGKLTASAATLSVSKNQILKQHHLAKHYKGKKVIFKASEKRTGVILDVYGNEKDGRPQYYKIDANGQTHGYFYVDNTSELFIEDSKFYHFIDCSLNQNNDCLTRVVKEGSDIVIPSSYTLGKVVSVYARFDNDTKTNDKNYYFVVQYNDSDNIPRETTQYLEKVGLEISCLNQVHGQYQICPKSKITYEGGYKSGTVLKVFDNKKLWILNNENKNELIETDDLHFPNDKSNSFLGL